MQTTMELLGQALEKDHAAAWADRLNITRQTFSNAKRVGRLSPALAGNLAIELGADPEHWVAIAAIEAEKDSALLARLKAAAEKWRKR